MNGKEGLVLQGCGGDPQEWLDGINGLLTDEGILKDGSKFENIAVFQNGGVTNIFFPFEDGVELDIGTKVTGDNARCRAAGQAGHLDLNAEFLLPHVHSLASLLPFSLLYRPPALPNSFSLYSGACTIRL